VLAQLLDPGMTTRLLRTEKRGCTAHGLARLARPENRVVLTLGFDTEHDVAIGHVSLTGMLEQSPQRARDGG